MLHELAADALAVEWVEGPSALGEIAPAWDALCDACPWSTPFSRPGWTLALGEVRAVAVRRERALVGVLPVATLASDASVWVLTGTGPSDVLDVVARADDALDVARAALRAVARREGWRALELHELREGSPLRAAAREGCAGRVTVDDPLSVAPVLAWPVGATRIDEVVDAGWARRVRYDRRRAAREGMRVEVATGPGPDADEALAAWRRNHAARWAARGEPGVVDGRVEAAVRALVRERRAEVVSLRVSSALRASYLVLRERAWAGLYLGGFDPELARLSPLVVILGETIERLGSEGVREVDFLRGGERYKYRWGARDRVQWRVRVER